MRIAVRSILGLWLVAGWTEPASAAPGAAAPLDPGTVVRIAGERLSGGARKLPPSVGVKILAPLPDGRVPALVHWLVPTARQKAPWEVAIDELESKIASLQAQRKQADESDEYRLALEIDTARRRIEDQREQARKKGLTYNPARWDAVELHALVLQWRSAGWAAVEAIQLGRFDAAALGAPPANTDIEARVRDHNLNSFSELDVTLYVELLTGASARTRRYQFLLEFFPNGTRQTFSLDGGVEGDGTCRGPLDEMMTAKYWFQSRRRAPAELVLARSISMCAPQDPSSRAERQRAGVEHYAWSDKYRRWQVFKGIEPEAFLIVAAQNPDRKHLAKLVKRIKQRGIRKRVRLVRGYPRILRGDDVLGLKAGAWFAALGVCKEQKEAQEIVRHLRRRFRAKGLAYAVRGIRLKGASRLRVGCPPIR